MSLMLGVWWVTVLTMAGTGVGSIIVALGYINTDEALIGWVLIPSGVLGIFAAVWHIIARTRSRRSPLAAGSQQ